MSKFSNGFPVNELGEIVVSSGNGSSNIVGTVSVNAIPVDSATGGLRLNKVAQLATDAVGNPVGIGAGAKTVNINRTDLAPEGFPLVFAPLVGHQAASANATLANVSRVSGDGKNLNGLSITANAGTNCSVDFNVTSTTIASGLVGFLFYVTVPAGEVIAPTFYLADGSGFTNAYSRNTSIYQTGWYYFCPGKPTDSQTPKWGVVSGTPAFGTTGFTRIRVRLDYSSGKTPNIELYGVFEAPKPSVSKVAFVLDDGWLTQYTVAAPIFERYRAPMTCAIIAGLVDVNPAYMTLAQLKDLKARGHQIAVHGPTGGTGSLLNYSGDANPKASVLADLAYHQSYVVNNGLAENGSERCYVYPQGYYQFSNGDTRIIDAMKSLGFIGARGVAGNLDPMKPVHGYDPFSTLFVAGHSWSSSDETGNITAIIARINEAAASGRDVLIMMHKFLTTTPTDVMEIQDTNLIKILEAVAKNRQAGTQKFSYLSDILFSHAGLQIESQSVS